MAQFPYPQPKSVADLKKKFLRPATTSNFQCWFTPPESVKRWINTHRVPAGFGEKYDSEFSEDLSLLCASATLPGSMIATHEIQNDYSGVTERHGYRRQYDERADFTFYVDHNYSVITFFENWMSYITNEQYTKQDGSRNQGVETPYYSYRVNYPGRGGVGEGYKTQICIKKFEKDYVNRYLQYRYINAFPISISSMPVSYDQAQLLKCTVSFTYSRYVVDTTKAPSYELNLQRPDGGSFPVRVDDGRPTLAQIVDQLEASGETFGTGVLGP